ncbi:MAG: PAS domain S-box protein [Solirubrobacterales bacterium]
MPVPTVEQLQDVRTLAGFLFQKSHEGVSLVDDDGVIAVVNPAFAEMLDYTPHELAGQRFADLTSKPDTEANLKAFEDLVAGRLKTFRMSKQYHAKHSSDLVRCDVTVEVLPEVCRVQPTQSTRLIIAWISRVHVLDVQDLDAEAQRKVLIQMVGGVMVEQWRLSLGALLLLIGVIRVDDLFGMLRALL